MALDATARDRLVLAGGAALRFNAPLGPSRATALADALGAGASSVVDLGCGRGALLLEAVARHGGLRAIGIDTSGPLIDDAGRAAAARGLADRLTFQVADAARWRGPVDGAVCIGASQAFGGPSAALSRLARLVAAGVGLVGELVWAARPDPDLEPLFGPLPVGPSALARSATAAGWTVIDTDLSTLAEWDDFESGWVAGVRGVGTSEAAGFADERWSAYERYRGVVGFAWLRLHR